MPAPTATDALLSKVTQKAQTTLPSGVRKALGISAGDTVAYVIEGDHAVIRKATAPESNDPALAPFLRLLAQDIARHPDRLAAVAPSLVGRIRALTVGVPVTLDEPIDGPVAL